MRGQTRWIATACVAIGALLVSACGSGGPSGPTIARQVGPYAPMTTAELASAMQVLNLVNAERAAAGQPALLWGNLAAEAAHRHSTDMRNRNYFDHVNPDGAGPDARLSAAGQAWTGVGENIARGQPTEASVMNSWMNSPGHRANILSPDFTHIGISRLDGPGGPWWTQVFYRP